MSGIAQSFSPSNLVGEFLVNPTSLDFGPNGNLYVTQQDGTILEYTVIRDGAPLGNGTYSVTNTNIINEIKTGVPNHNDDGSISTLTTRQVTGILLSGTAANPIIYVSSSDSRIGGGPGGSNTNLDTNSGVLSRLTWTGSNWDKVDLVRGLPRCEENHSTNDMDMFQKNGNTYLLLQQGGNTNKGAPSNNFAGTQETFLSATILIINISQLEQMESANGGPYIDTRSGSVKYIYDLPTLNDPEKVDINNTNPNFPYAVGHPMYNATIDLGDPFGGNNGLNQAFTEVGSPVQIFSSGYRNAYDIVVTSNGNIYTSDNGGNQTWGGLPVIYTSSNVIKGDESTTTYDPLSGDYITNDFNESGSATVGDSFHYVGTINDANGTYYGGHPVPIRAFPSRAGVIKHTFNGSSWVVVSSHNWADLLLGTSGYFNSSFTIANFPDDPDLGYSLVGNTSDPRVNIFDVVNSSTNGICEYTASNFGGAMQGDILTASFGGQINRYELNTPGDGVLQVHNNFLEGFGSLPLDVIAQGDGDPFPGTIWATTYGSGNITIFEPDVFVCLPTNDPGYDPLADSDNDGYSNGDEVDNGTDHCSGGSKPNDYDGDFISDLNDPDDDNDGILDVNDAFAIDSNNGTNTNLPVNYPFWNNDPGTGFFGLGFTGLMLDPGGTTNYLDQYDENNLSFGGAGGKATIDAVSEGDPFQNTNTQENGFLFGVNVDSNSLPFTIHSKIETPFAGVPPVDFQSYGIFIGTGDQDNYLKVVINDGITNGDGIDGFEVLLENGGSASSTAYDVPGLIAATAVDIYIGINPSNNTAIPFYSLDDGTTVSQLGSPITLPLSFLDPNDSQGLAVGIISTSVGPGDTYTATWDFINITEDGPSELAVSPSPVDFGLFATNSSTVQQNIVFTNSGGPGSGAIDITGVNITGADASLFSTNATPPFQIGPGSNQTWQLDFSPDSNPGTKSASLELIHTGNNSPLIIPISAELSGFALRINAGGLQDVFGGNVFEADQFFTGGGTYHNVASPIPLIYQTERNSFPQTFSYDIPVANGDYTVILHFAEIYWGAGVGGPGGAGRRIFDVELEGLLVLDNYDINADVGPETPVAKSFLTTVSDGIINLNFSALASVGGVDQPKVSAIEIIGGALQHPPITINPIADQFNIEGELVNGLAVAASGGDPNENFTYSISGEPAGIGIEPTNGQIFGTVAVGAASGGPGNDGVHPITIQVSKPSSTSAIINFNWTITNPSSNCSFNTLANASFARFESRAEQVGDKIYVIGGWLPGLIASADIEIYDIVNESWTLGAPMPTPLTHAGSAVVGTDIWIIGGFVGNNGGPPTNIVQIYNTITNTWQSGPSIPSSVGSGAATLNGSKIHFFGGLLPDRQTDIADHYVLDLNNMGAGWTTAAPMPNARNHHSAESFNGIVYAIGGWFGHDVSTQNTDLVHAYDPNTNLWTQVSSLPRERSHFEPGTSVHNGKIIIAGGRDGNFNFENVITYDPQLDLWAELCDLPEKLMAPTAQAINDKLFVSGGAVDGITHTISTGWLQLDSEISQLNWTDLNENENYTGRGECGFVQAGNKFYLIGGIESQATQVYDYSSDTWTTLPNAPLPFNHFQAVEYNGLIWVIGALDGNNFPNDAVVDHVWIFDPVSTAWIQGPEIPAARKRGASGLAVYANKLYLVGGSTNGHNGGYVPWLDAYDPELGIWTTLADAPRARDHFQATVINDKLYVVGGRQSGGPGGFFEPTIPEVDIYDFVSDTWSTLTSDKNIPTPRAGAATAYFNNNLLVVGGEVNNQIVYGTLTTDALNIMEGFDLSTQTWQRLSDTNYKRHGTQTILSGGGLFIASGSNAFGIGTQKNMEVLGTNTPTGTQSIASTLTVPSNVVVEAGINSDISLNVAGGNVGTFIRSMALSGPDATDFVLVSGELNDQLLLTNSNHTLSLGYIGSSTGASATLTINYGAADQAIVLLTGNSTNPQAWFDKNENENYLARHECGFVQAGDKFYLIGGNETAKVDIYDYATDTWTQLPDAPEMLHHFQAVAYGGLIWIVGALKGTSFPNDDVAEYIWILDPTSNEWIQGAEIPIARRRGANGMVVYNDKFYLIGGSSNGHAGGFVPWFDEFDPATGIWTTLADAPSARDHHYSAVIGDKLYAVGGRQTGGAGGFYQATIPEVDVYDFLTQTWSTLPSNLNLPTARGGPAVAVLDNKLMVIGGNVENQMVYGVLTTGALNITESFDPVSQTWTRLGDTNHLRRATQAIVSGNGIFLTAGSAVNAGGQQKNMEYYVEDNPVGSPSIASTFTGPSSVQFLSASASQIDLDVASGNVGVIVESLIISGPNAGDFTIQSGNLAHAILLPNTQHQIDVLYSGTGNNATATLTVNYGSGTQLNIALEGPVNNNLTWIDKNENENYTARHECSFVQAGDRFYLMGGRESPKDVDVYDYTSNSWTTLSNSAPFDFNHFQAVEYQGLIWVIGAFKTAIFPDEIPADFIWVFDPANQIWYQGPQIPVGRRRGSSGLAVYNDKFYIIAGNTLGHNAGYVPWFDEYDPQTGIWTSLMDAPRSRDHFSTAVIGSKLYVAGGRLSGGAGGYFAPTIPDVDVYDFISGTWSTLPSAQNIPTPRAAASTVNFNNRLIVIGGEVENQLVYGVLTSDALRITEEYDPNNQTWTRLADMNFDRHGTQGIVSGGGIFTLGGSPNLGGGNQKNMEVFGQDSPVGSPGVPSLLTGPSLVQILDNAPESFNIDASTGNMGVFVSDMQITGVNAADFNIITGELTNSLIKSANSHSITVGYTGTLEGATATLNVNYSNGAQLNINLEGNLSANQSGVISLTLVNADLDSDLVTLSEGLQINESLVQGIGLNIRANTNPAVVGSVSLSLTGPVGNSRVENVAPYALFGDNAGDYNGVSFPEGNYVITANAFSGPGTTGTMLGSLSVQFSIVIQGGGNLPPTALIGATPLTGEGPLQVNFTGSNSTDDVGVVTYLWDFKDGNFSSLADPSHTFNNPGDYNVDLTVTDGGGLSDTSSLLISVTSSNQPPTAVVSATPLTGVEPLQVNFTGSNSTDDVGVTTYLWDFKDGNFSSLADPNHTFNIPGDYNVDLTVTDAGGLTDISSILISVSSTNQPPIAILEATPESGDLPLLVNFTGSNSTDDDGITVYFWDFDDGSTSTLANPSNTFSLAGNYNVSLTVTDTGGLQHTDFILINVNDPNQTGVVDLTLVNADTDTEMFEITPGMQIDEALVQGLLLNIKANTNPATVGSVLLEIVGTLNNTRVEGVAPYALFGDNAGDYGGVNFPLGSYTVSATAFSGPSQTGSVLGMLSRQFDIVPSGGGNLPPTAIGSATPLNGIAPLGVTFTGSNSTDDNGITSYLWNFDDTNTSTLADPIHTYTVPGTYNATLTVMDAGGLTDMTSVTVVVSSVSNNPPVVTNPGTQNNTEGEAVSLQIVATDESSMLDYQASGLPPGLNINMNTGFISGILDTGSGGGALLETNGLIIIDAESGNVVPGWSETSTGGATGIIASTNSFDFQNGGTIPYQIEVTTAGVYRFNWRSFFSGSNPTDENDSWLRFPNNSDVWFFGYQGIPVDEASMISNLQGAQNNVVFPVGSGREGIGTTPNGSGSNNYFKVVRSGGASEVYDWQALVSDNDGHDVYVWFVNPGTYTMEISERSAGHAIDRVALYKVDGQNYTDSELTAASESSNLIGAAANSPYTVDITVSDDATPVLSSMVQFIWNVNPLNGAPTAVVNATPLSGDTPLLVNFTGSNSTDDIGIVSYLWDFKDGSTSNLANPVHTFNNPGSYNVSLTVTDGGGLMDASNVLITVNDPGQSAVASFTLINADTDSDLFDLSDSQQIDQTVTQGMNLNIRANTNPGVVGSVFLDLTGPVNNARTENVAPYALFGDFANDYFGTTLPLGNYTIMADVYSGAGLSGTLLGTKTLQFSIVDTGSKSADSEDEEVSNVLELGTELYPKFIVFPNPTIDRAEINSSQIEPINSPIYVYDITGRLVKKIDPDEARLGAGRYAIELSGLESGIYNLRFAQAKNPVMVDLRIVLKK